MNEKKIDIWIPLYIGEYTADTMAFTTEQHGAYPLLLMTCWKAKGVFPIDDESIGIHYQIATREVARLQGKDSRRVPGG